MTKLRTLWRHVPAPRREITDPDELARARNTATDQARRIGLVLPVLLEHRERNHFADRIAAAYREAPR